MAKCQLTGRAFMTGRLVSHSNRKSKTRRFVNVRNKRIWDPEKGAFVRVTISTRALRTLSRKGWEAFGNEKR